MSDSFHVSVKLSYLTFDHLCSMIGDSLAVTLKLVYSYSFFSLSCWIIMHVQKDEFPSKFTLK